MTKKKSTAILANPAPAKPASAAKSDKKGFRISPRMAIWAPFLGLGLFVVAFYWPVLSVQGFLWNDFIEQNFPYRLFAARALSEGVFPFWNPYVFSGMPFFADIQAAVLYPLNLLLTLFVSGGWLSPILVEYQVIAHILLAGACMTLLGLDVGLSRVPALAAGTVLMFSAFFTTHIFHVNLIHAAAWIPLAFLFVKRAIEKISLLYAGLAAATLAVAFLAGYPQLMVHAYYLLGAWFVFMLVVRRKTGGGPVSADVSRGALFAGLVALAVGLSAVQLLPTQELGAHSARPTLAFAESAEGSFRLYRFITLLIPKFYGSPGSVYWGISPADVNAGLHSYWETAMYVGVLPLMLAVLAAIFVRTPTVWFFSGLGILSLLLAMGDSFFAYWLFYSFLPGFNRFRVPARFAFVFAFSISLLAGFGLQWLIQQARGVSERVRLRIGRIFYSIAGVTLAGAVLVSMGALRGIVTDFALNTGRFDPRTIEQLVAQRLYPALTGQTWIFACIAAVSAVLIALRVHGRLGARLTAWTLPAVLFIDLLIFGYGFAAQNVDPRAVYARTPIIEQLQEQSARELFRINMRDSKPGTTDLGGRNMLLQKNQGSVHELFLMEGYNPLRLGRQLIDRSEQILDILNVKYYIARDPANNRMGFALNEDRLPRAWFARSHKVLSEEQRILSVLKSPDFNPRESVILEEQPKHAPADARGDVSAEVAIDSYGCNTIHLTVQTKRPGFVVLSEIYYPHWKAKVDGQEAPLYRANYALRAIPVEAGTHTIECYYQSPAFIRGLGVSLGSLAVLAAALIGPAIISRQKKNAPRDRGA